LLALLLLIWGFFGKAGPARIEAVALQRATFHFFVAWKSLQFHADSVVSSLADGLLSLERAPRCCWWLQGAVSRPSIRLSSRSAGRLLTGFVPARRRAAVACRPRSPSASSLTASPGQHSLLLLDRRSACSFVLRLLADCLNDDGALCSLTSCAR
jgi:hypothetical protein